MPTYGTLLYKQYTGYCCWSLLASITSLVDSSVWVCQTGGRGRGRDVLSERMASCDHLLAIWPMNVGVYLLLLPAGMGGVQVIWRMTVIFLPLTSL